MVDVIVLCEGKTEQFFCNDVVAQHLYAHGVLLSGTLAGRPGKKRGGIKPWGIYREDLLRLARQRQDRHVGVLVDYYAMPASWPGRTEASQKAPDGRGRHVEDALTEDMRRDLSGRFLPCVQLHEFETLLFAAPARTAQSWAGLTPELSTDKVAHALQATVSSYRGHIEHINDSPSSAPSKRVEAIVPAYNKVLWGIHAVKDIGLADLRSQCPWLERWLTALEGLSVAP